MRVSEPYEALQGQIESAIHILQNGGVVAIPTDTLYGLAACAFNEKAVEQVFQLKGRSKGMAIPLLLSDTEDVNKCAVEIPDVAWALTEHFWPGALTIVLKKADVVPDIVSGGMETIAVRVPDHRIPRALARELGTPITGTSANRSGRPGLTTARAVHDEFGDEIDLVIDDGVALGGVASTLLDLSREEPRILRQGSVSICEIEKVCGIKVNV
jgi:L-threonylcarbamoyladenylate synthase